MVLMLNSLIQGLSGEKTAKKKDRDPLAQK